MPIENASETVKLLLESAQLKVSDDEFQRFVNVYPTLREQADSLYLPELEPESPALSFDPTAGLS